MYDLYVRMLNDPVGASGGDRALPSWNFLGGSDRVWICPDPGPCSFWASVRKLQWKLQPVIHITGPKAMGQPTTNRNIKNLAESFPFLKLRVSDYLLQQQKEWGHKTESWAWMYILLFIHLLYNLRSPHCAELLLTPCNKAIMSNSTTGLWWGYYRQYFAKIIYPSK